jgi:hypothetical protein
MQVLNSTEVASGYILDAATDRESYLKHIYKCIGARLGYAIVEKYTPTSQDAPLPHWRDYQRQFKVSVVVGSPDEYAAALKQARDAGYDTGFKEGKAVAVDKLRTRLASRAEYLLKDL